VPAYVFVIDPFYPVSIPQWILLDAKKKFAKIYTKFEAASGIIFQDHRWAPVSILF
jgi:hypothetical protein